MRLKCEFCKYLSFLSKTCSEASKKETGSTKCFADVLRGVTLPSSRTQRTNCPRSGFEFALHFGGVTVNHKKVVSGFVMKAVRKDFANYSDRVFARSAQSGRRTSSPLGKMVYCQFGVVRQALCGVGSSALVLHGLLHDLHSR